MIIKIILQLQAIPPLIQKIQSMSIVEVDKKQYTLLMQSTRQSWQQRFKKNLYLQNYKKYFRKQVNQDIIQQQNINSAGCSLAQLIKQSKVKPISLYQQRKQYYDKQIHQTHYSPYSVLIPLQNQSYMNDQVVNTFSYMLHLKDTSKRNQSCNFYHQINTYFKDGKNKDQKYIKDQWLNLKNKFMCEFDSIKALGLLIQMKRKDSSIFQELYKKYGNNCHREVFFYRVTKASMYICPSMKTNSNLKISIQIGDQINEKTLPLVMKTWYCALCLSYDCQRHRLQANAIQYDHQYVSIKNKKSQAEHIQYIIKLLKFLQGLRCDSNMSDIQQKPQKMGCGRQCFQKLTKADIIKLFRSQYKLISPLAKSLLKMGIQIFSYNPCQIAKIFQSKFDKNLQTSIKCSQIFLHFVQQSNLTQIMGNKMKKSEIQYLSNESSKILNLNIKIPVNQPKFKKNFYQQKRSKYQNPQLAICMHNFIGHNPIDTKCQKCVCKERGFCLPSCLCTQDCEIKRLGCVCKNLDSCQTQKCLCFINKLECQPGICGDCFSTKANHPKKNCCRNDQLLRQLNKRIYVGISKIPGAGLGAFAGEDYHKNDLVCKYSGQQINSDIDFIREVMIKDLSFYNFDSPNGKTLNASIDARFLGNKARFINHGNEGQQNLRAQTIFSNGTEYIALYAKIDIKQGQQLRFNYDGNGVLYELHRDKYPFIKAPKKI